MGQLKFGMENRFIILLKCNQNCPQLLAITHHNVTEIRQFSSDFLFNFTLPSYPIYNSLPIPKTKQNKDKNQQLYLRYWDTEVDKCMKLFLPS